MSNKLRRSALSLTITISLFSGILTSSNAQACSGDSPMLGSMCVYLLATLHRVAGHLQTAKYYLFLKTPLYFHS